MPVVATDAGGVAELLGRGTDAAGTLVESGRPDQIARAVDDLLAADLTRTAMASRARRRGERNFSPSVTWGAYDSIHQSLIGTPATKELP